MEARGKCLEEAKKATIFTSEQRAFLTPRAWSGVGPRNIWHPAVAHGTMDGPSNNRRMVYNPASSGSGKSRAGAAVLANRDRGDRATELSRLW